MVQKSWIFIIFFMIGFLKFYFFSFPKEIFKKIETLFFGIERLFCLKYHFLHLFSPWKRYVFYRKRGFEFMNFLETLIGNLFSRFIGILMRIIVLLIGTVVSLLGGVFSFLFLILYFVFPFFCLYLFFKGLSLWSQ